MRGETIDDQGLVLTTVTQWAERGWLRRLDAALARFIADRCPSAGGEVLLATALVAHLEGQGHTCLVLDDLLDDPDRLLGWNADALQALHGLMDRLPDDWIDALRSCAAVHVEGNGPEHDGRPLVLSGKRLYLRRYWRHERQVAAEVLARAGASHPVDEGVAREWLDRLFPATVGIEWQKVACAVALRGRLSIITGGPGTGKTWTAARFLALRFATSADPARLRIALAAPTGKAAARLKQSIGGALAALQDLLGDTLPLQELASHLGAAKTLHSLLGSRTGTRRFRHDASNPLDVDVLIVDEASMVHLEMMDALLAALPATAQVILLGDKDQLASVEAGAVLGDLCRDAKSGRYRSQTVRYVEAVTGQRLPDEMVDEAGPMLAQQTVMLRQSRRFSGAIGELALAVNSGDAEAAARCLSAAPVEWLVSPSPRAVVALASGAYRSYLEAIRERPVAEDLDAWVRGVLAAFDRFRVLCAVREGDWGVAGLNHAIERSLADDRLLSPRGEWYEGRPVIVTRNDYGLGIYNGDIGIALKASPRDANLRAYFVEGTTVRSVSVSRLADVETAFAMTVHKSQGSEFDHTVLVLPDEINRVTTRELIYTGITRARSRFTLVSSRRESLSEAIAQTTRRSSGLLEFIRSPDAHDRVLGIAALHPTYDDRRPVGWDKRSASQRPALPDRPKRP